MCRGPWGGVGFCPQLLRGGSWLALCVLASGLGRLLQAVVCRSVWFLCVCSARWHLSGAHGRSGPLAPHTLTPGPSAAVVLLGEEFHMRGPVGAVSASGHSCVICPQSLLPSSVLCTRVPRGVCSLVCECLVVPSAVS